MYDYNDNSAAELPGEDAPPNAVSLGDGDVELTDYPAFEDADTCPECDTPRPFGKTCPSCGYTRTPQTRESSGAARDSESDVRDVSLDRVVITVVAGRAELTAKAKAKAATKHSDLTPARSSPLVAVRLLDDLGDETLFPNKWGELPGIVEGASPAGEALLETAADIAGLDDSTADVDPVLLDEYGTPIRDRDSLDELLAGDSSITNTASEDTVWLVPALAYRNRSRPPSEKSSEDAAVEDAHDPRHTVEAAEEDQFKQVMSTLEGQSELPEY